MSLSECVTEDCQSIAQCDMGETWLCEGCRLEKAEARVKKLEKYFDLYMRLQMFVRDNGLADKYKAYCVEQGYRYKQEGES